MFNIIFTPPTLSFTEFGVTQTLRPQTRNSSDVEQGYMFVLHDVMDWQFNSVCGSMRQLNT